VKSQQSLKLKIVDYVFYVFFKCRFKKRKKSRFWIFRKKKRKKTYSRTMAATKHQWTIRPPRLVLATKSYARLQCCVAS